MKKPEDIRKMDERIAEFRQANESAKDSTRVQEKSYSRSAAGFQISAELLAGVLIGAGIGYFLDILFATKPWMLALFTIFGGAAGILSIYKTFKSEDGKSKE